MKRILTLLVVVAIGLAATQAFGALSGSKNIADFDYVYNMDVMPTTQDLDANSTFDFTLPGTSSWNVAGSVSGGIWSIDASTGTPPLIYHEISPADIFPATQDFASGVTAEIRVKVIRDDLTGYQMRIQFDGASSLDIVAKTGSVRWGIDEIGTDALTTEILVADNATDFHVYRLAQWPAENKFSLWRDEFCFWTE